MTKTRQPAIADKGWQNQPLTDDCKAMIRKAVDEFIVGNGHQKDIPSPSTSIARQILPYLAAEDPRWKIVQPVKLDKYKKKAHSQYLKTVERLLKDYRAHGFKTEDQDDEMSDDQSNDDEAMTPTWDDKDKKNERKETADQEDGEQNSDSSDTDSDKPENADQKDEPKK